MSYVTHCTCTEDQLAHVGCDCDHTGPEKIVLTFADKIAAETAARDALEIADRAHEAAYWDVYFAVRQNDTFIDPREDYAEWAREAAKHQ